ncbi:DNA cytosine methyltransferase [Methylobacterium sp. Leaf87]|uniref:DNA cytosine methyltransferase n=1 Tax=Methylobacterium sp. Leaf87 TaxID=1736243 RepID=UPI0009EA4D7B|nr:DNA cytosine methyltransferase [Methylobacterium sp. Leaf87]
MAAYYNEIDPYAAAWLRNLIAAGHIAPGDVDERSILDVRPSELRGYEQCHFFAGIGVWSRALRLATWADDRPVWTGSCPCQPFSAAGKGGGFADERHLWPAWHHLIRECRPARVLGEQVDGKDGRLWVDLVQTDLEADGYAFGPIVLPAAGVGAPHPRHRTWFVADADGDGREPGRQGFAPVGHRPAAQPDRGLGLVGDAGRQGSGRHAGAVPGAQGEGAGERGRAWHQLDQLGAAGAAVHLGDTGEQRLSHAELEALLGAGRGSEGAAAQQSGRTFWSGPDWLFCRDGKWRPVEPGTFPLVASAPARMGRLRAYGNAICAEAAKAFIQAADAALADRRNLRLTDVFA